MASYRLFMFNAAGLVDQVSETLLSDDAGAVAAARALGHPHVVEVMSGQTRIARVPPAARPVAGRRLEVAAR